MSGDSSISSPSQMMYNNNTVGPLDLSLDQISPISRVTCDTDYCDDHSSLSSPISSASSSPPPLLPIDRDRQQKEQQQKFREHMVSDEHEGEDGDASGRLVLLSDAEEGDVTEKEAHGNGSYGMYILGLLCACVWRVDIVFFRQISTLCDD